MFFRAAVEEFATRQKNFELRSFSKRIFEKDANYQEISYSGKLIYKRTLCSQKLQ